MAYNDPASAVAGTVATAAFVNTNYRDSIKALYAGASAIATVAVGGVPYAATTTQLGILNPGANGAVFTSKGAGVAPGWGPSPIAMAIVFGG